MPMKKISSELVVKYFERKLKDKYVTKAPKTHLNRGTQVGSCPFEALKCPFPKLMAFSFL